MTRWGNGVLRVLSTLVVAVFVSAGLQACKPACGLSSPPNWSEAGRSAIGMTATNVPAARPKPKPTGKAPCPPKSKSTHNKKLFGANGNPVTSKTLVNGVAGKYKYRIDVENPAPGKRAGSLHVQLGGRGSTHYEYRRGGRFYARDGTSLPTRVQRAIDASPKAQKAINSGLRILGEK